MDYITSYINSIDPALRTLPDSVYTIWWTVLILVLVAIVPLAVFLLQRTLNGAISIRRYFAEMLTAGVGIAENTSSITALNDTMAVAGNMVETSKKLDEHSRTIAEVLSDRAAKGTTS